jgi:hypothetical protein
MPLGPPLKLVRLLIVVLLTVRLLMTVLLMVTLRSYTLWMTLVSMRLTARLYWKLPPFQ